MTKKIITGIDIGTTKVVAIIAEKESNNQELGPDDKIKILGVGEFPSNGLKKGVVVDIQETTKSLQNAITEAEEQAEIEIDDVYVGITGDHITGMNYNGKISISNASQTTGIGNEITEKDVNEVLKAARAINLPPGRRILHILSQSYEVDDRTGIHNPIGLSGNTLSVNVHIVTSQINVEKDIETCFNNLGIHIRGFVLEPLASAHSVLDNNEKDLGIALIDIGGGTTDILVYCDGGIRHSAALALAGHNITLDISYRFKTTVEQAEELKHKFGIAKTALADNSNIIEIKGVRGRESINITQEDLSEVIEPRMTEILKLACIELEKGEFKNKLNFGVVITGGGSELNNITDLAQDIFSMPVKLGFPDMIDDEESKYKDNPRFATAIGIIQYAAQCNTPQGTIDNSVGLLGVIKKIIKKLTGWY